MNEIELALLNINKLFKPNFHFSLDIYYDDVCKNFVCKLSNFGENLDEIKHFRTHSILTSLQQAHNFLANYNITLDKL